MKDRFMEQDGLLFLMCEPEPLELDANYPCLTQYSKQGRIGRLNKELCANDDMVIYYNPPFAPDYLRYDIIAKHCPEGSKEWALWQMMNGEKVKHERDATNYYYMNENGMLVSKGEQIIEDESRWLKTSSRNGWKIYEEPKPKPEVGKWYQHKKRKHYACVVAVNGEECRIRFAGNPEGERYGWKENSFFESSYEPASLEPDFSKAKAGDKCFHTLHGGATISNINDLNDLQRRASPLNVIGIAMDSDVIDISKHTVEGRLFHKFMHPTLFHSAAQCAAYFAEVALKERGDNK